MRIVHTSDWHLGKPLEQISRIEEQREFINCLCEIVEEQNIDLVLVAGDIYDTYNPSAAAEELFYDAIDRLNGKGKRAVVVIAGNHDNPERLCAASPLAYKNGVILLGYPRSDAGMYNITGGSIRVVDSGPGWLELRVPGCEEHAVMITLPYPSESRLEEVLSQQADEGALQRAYSDKIGSIFSSLSQKFRDDTVNLAVGHLFLRGGKESESERTLQLGGALTVDPGVLPAKAHFIALGHLHRPQEIKNAPCPAFYSGSPLAYSFSEADYSKAVFMIDAVPGEKAEIKPVYLDCGKPLRRWVAEGIGQALEWCEEGRDPHAWVDLEIVTERVLTIEEQKRLRAMHPGIINIRPRLKTEVVVLNPGGREGRKIDELFRDYYQYRVGSEISGELMGAFIEVLNDEEADGFMAGGAGDETEAS
jgi:exonuclease SbcD